MKKTPLTIKTLIPIFALIAAAGAFFCITYINLEKDFTEKSLQAAAIEAIPPAQKEVTFSAQKEQTVYESRENEYFEDGEVFATYQHENITFTSYSEAWGEEKLEALCTELLSNTHGSEIDYLEGVIVHGGEDEQAIGRHNTNYEALKIPVSLYSILPGGFTFSMPNVTSILTLYNGDGYTTVEQMAITLAHEYGHHFTLHYFTLKGTDEEVENDPYFIARYQRGIGIRYSSEELDDTNDYFENHMWYLIEIAAEDYVYLMGSPATRRIVDYYDSRDLLLMDIRGEDSEMDAYYELAAESSFNQTPHENILLPLPDRIEGLPEIFYGAIGLEPPEYTDRSAMARDIQIKVSSRSKVEKTYYNITWDKPWKSEDVTYTLVAYDENDEILGAIKSISGNEEAKASIGSVVVETKRYYHWYDSDYWTDQEFLRLRVIVTFGDGTAAVSQPLDRSFS